MFIRVHLRLVLREQYQGCATGEGASTVQGSAMETNIPQSQLEDPDVRVAERILRSCVHCGFCNATCPTFQVTGNELEGPRGRIYLMKSVLEGRIALDEQVVAHLDNCLSCFSCETTCPSGVRYSHLIDPMRARIEKTYRRPLAERLQRWALALLLPHPGRFRLALRLARAVKPVAWLMPRNVRAMLDMTPRQIPPRSRVSTYEVHAAQGVRRARVALLTGCAQEVLGPNINEATIRVLTRLGCEVVLPRGVGCCGALIFHMGNQPGSLPLMKNNIDHWHGEMERGGLEHIVINTSGCGTVVKDYGHIFRDDPQYREKAAAVSAIAVDFSELAHARIDEQGLPEEIKPPESLRVAYHDACSLQHGQQVRAQPRNLLRSAGFEVVEIPEGYMCCGSAGTYNLLKPEMAGILGGQKAEHIARVRPQVVAAGNIGCIEQIARYTTTPVVHTAELLDWALGGRPPGAVQRGDGAARGASHARGR